MLVTGLVLVMKLHSQIVLLMIGLLITVLIVKMLVLTVSSLSMVKSKSTTLFMKMV
jgi:hypothetical protein